MDNFSEELLLWYHKNKRDLPWRNTSDPYEIWISEIMLQQTRVETVIPYYENFLENFPTVYKLAQANQQQVLKCWEGLGYYSRGRNLHHASKTIVEDFEGKIPSTYKEITSLTGIGPYTAAAVLSIAYQKKYAVVDGNVIRVITRFKGIKNDIRKSATKTRVQQFADSVISNNRPGDFNQALMELGATVCTPKNPNCEICPLAISCNAHKTAQTDVIPYKSPSKKIPHHHIGVGLIVDDKNRLLISLRPDNAMLGGLWEFPGGKKDATESIRQTVKRELKEELTVEVKVFDKFIQLKHAYSHFKITLHAFWCKIVSGHPVPKSSEKLKWVTLSEIDEFPFPKANKSIIKDLKKLDISQLQSFLNND